MRGTWLIVAAIVGLGLAATVDAVRDDEKPEPSAPKPQKGGPPVPEARKNAATLLRDQAIRGTITYLDEGCELSTLGLPDLEERPTLAPTVVVSTPAPSSCRLSLSRGAAFSVGPTAPDPRGDLSAQCDDGRVTLTTRTGELLADARGCAPAWKPGGTLTFIRDGELVEAVARSQGDVRLTSEIVLSRGDLVRALERDPWGLEDPILREAAWLDDDLVAVVARERGENDYVFALFRSARLIAAPPFPYPRLVHLRVSPFGSYVAARFARGQGLIMLDRSGDLVSTGIRTAHAVTWSPDEVWTALATDDGVFVFPTGERAVSLIRLPIAARDLVWR